MHVKEDPNVATEEECSDYYDNASHYDVLWGKDNIHIGYYPHLATRGLSLRHHALLYA